MKKVLQNWTITSGLQSVSLPCNWNLMLPPCFYPDLSKDIFLAIGKYHSMYHRHICIKHLSKSQEEILIALDWECLTECFIKRKAARHPPDSAHSPRAGWDKLPFCIPNLLPLTAVGGNFYTDFIRIRFFKEILYSEAVHMSFHLAHFLFFSHPTFFLFFFFPSS